MSTESTIVDLTNAASAAKDSLTSALAAVNATTTGAIIDRRVTLVKQALRILTRLLAHL